MSTPIPRHQHWIDTDQIRKQEAKRQYIVSEICRRCRDPEHGLLFSACQFELGSCPLQDIAEDLMKERHWDDRFADLEIHGGD